MHALVDNGKVIMLCTADSLALVYHPLSVINDDVIILFTVNNVAE